MEDNKNIDVATSGGSSPNVPGDKTTSKRYDHSKSVFGSKKDKNKKYLHFMPLILLAVVLIVLWIFYKAGWSYAFYVNEYGYICFDFKSYFKNVFDSWNSFLNNFSYMADQGVPLFDFDSNPFTLILNSLIYLINFIIFVVNILFTPLRLAVLFVNTFCALLGIGFGSPFSSLVDGVNGGVIPYIPSV